MPKKVARGTNPTVIGVANLVHLLADGTRNVDELAEQTGLNVDTVLRYTRAMYHAGAIHIAGWQADARGIFSIRLFKLGELTDVPAPTRDSRARSRMRPHVTEIAPGRRVHRAH